MCAYVVLLNVTSLYVFVECDFTVCAGYIGSPMLMLHVMLLS